MPELPDVENYRRYFVRHALRRPIEGVHAPDARTLRGTSARRLRETVLGRRFAGADRHGKHLLARLDGGGVVTFHFGMTGAFAACAADEAPPRFTRLRFDFDGRCRLSFTDPRRLGRIGLADDPASFVVDQGLGIDALDRRLTVPRLAALLAQSSAGIKAALMAQDRIAGIGNIYSDEILFQAGIDPRADAAGLDRRAVGRLHRALRRVLRTAIDRGAGWAGFAEKLPDGWLLRHRRSGAACPRCGGAVRAARISGRTAYFCPRCQKDGG
ncbi:MAG: Fpg/Nei family DNA glycosylase [Rhodospirillales bacterium]